MLNPIFRRILTTAVILIVFSCAGRLHSQTTSTIEQQTAEKTPVRVEETTAEFARVVEQVNAFVEKHGVRKVLLVVDLDNTLLAMNQDLGSDQWFTWQESLLKQNQHHPELVANDFPGLLEVQGILFALSSMHPPQPELPKMLNGLIDQQVTTVVLTSRGKEFRNASERELKRFNYQIAQSTLRIKEKRGVFLPYELDRPRAHGLDSEIVMQLGRPRSVTYSNGIYLTAGQHKGYMLKTLLARADRGSKSDDAHADFAAIVFVDDHEKHTKRVHEAFRNSSLDMATFRYSREDGNVEKFKNSTKNHVVRDWNLLKAFTETVLVK